VIHLRHHGIFITSRFTLIQAEIGCHVGEILMCVRCQHFSVIVVSERAADIVPTLEVGSPVNVKSRRCEGSGAHRFSGIIAPDWIATWQRGEILPSPTISFGYKPEGMQGGT